jgi:hypothetical protein
VWWLDGRRIGWRERRELIGAIELVCLELAANGVHAHEWAKLLEGATPGTSITRIELRWEAWVANQRVLAAGLPRGIIGRLGVSYNLARMLMYNAAVAEKKGQIGRNDMAIARRVRDHTQASLRELQGALRDFGVHFEIEPIGSDELDAKSADSRKAR